MATDLKYLAYTAVLTATLWTPYIVSQVQANGFLSKANAMPAFWADGLR
jgi:hypothetical protein